MFLKRRKEVKEVEYKEFDYHDFCIWLDEILNKSLPKKAKGINFNLYEEDKPNIYGIQLVATKDFDAEDDDWACDEIFSSGENMFYFKNENNWETVQKNMEKTVKTYLEEGDFASTLKEFKGIALGFVDGDLSIVYKN